MILAVNRRARRFFQILQTWEAGLELKGWEVKSIRLGRISLGESFIKMHRGEAFLINAYIAPYQKSNAIVDSRRPRKLLLKKTDLTTLSSKIASKHLTLVPLKLYTKRQFIKLEIGLAKGKGKKQRRETEKRQTIKRRALEEARSYLRQGDV